ncbi:hypothetical protein [Nocardia sp. NPDC050406]|uniref:hypothetical protein n=1 Tax=Nocardia sp. NPDC050406 TaxID=3364318 RepID=UPI003789819E
MALPEDHATHPEGRTLLLVGVDPTLIDPRVMERFDVSGTRVTRDEIDADLAAVGFTVHRCVVDLGETAEAVLEKTLTARAFDCVMFGAGLRLVPEYTPLFERVLNVVHRLAPSAVLCFNTHPGDTVQAARRALG